MVVFNRFWLVFGLSQLFCSIGSNAQILSYSGGQGAGASRSGVNQMQLNGIQFTPKYSGGPGRGSALNSTGSLLLNGQPGILSFSGGFGGGSSKIVLASSLTLNGQSPPITQSELSFKGGSGSGSSSSKLGLGLLFGAVAQISYKGGVGRGTTSLKSVELLSLNGSAFVFKFPGGIGRGNSVLKTNLLRLNGVPFVSSLRLATTQILTFTASKSDDNVHMSWKASNIHNVQKFKVQNSADGNNFYSIGEVEKEVFGDDPDFTFDHNFVGNHRYFRVLVENLDSTIVTSEVVKIKVEKFLNQSNIQPNPATGVIQILYSKNLQEEEKAISIFTVSGKKIISDIQYENISQSNLNIEVLPSGIYFLEIQTSSKKERIKFVKQ